MISISILFSIHIYISRVDHIDNLDHDHIGLTQVVNAAVHLVNFFCWMDHHKTYLLLALFGQITPLWLKVVGGGP